jgi:uncharacterized membrane protein
MRTPIDVLKGWAGKPPHPPLTDASIGAYTVGVVMLVLGAFSVEKEQMAHGSLLAISGGLALALPTALTGLLDWLDIPKGTARKTIATTHLIVMLTATLLFAGTWLAQLDGYEHGKVKTLAWILGLVAEATLAVGGYLGGSLVFVFGTRVLGREDATVIQAVVPGRIEGEGQQQQPTEGVGR